MVHLHAARFKCESNPTANRFKVRALHFLHQQRVSLEIVEALVESLQIKQRGPSPQHNRFPNITNIDSRYLVELEDGSSLDSDSVILATPAFVSGTLLASFTPKLASDLKNIPYASTATVSLAYRQSDLIPRVGWLWLRHPAPRGTQGSCLHMDIDKISAPCT